MKHAVGHHLACGLSIVIISDLIIFDDKQFIKYLFFWGGGLKIEIGVSIIFCFIQFKKKIFV